MTKIIIVNNQSDIIPNNKWIESGNFEHKDRMVDREGRFLASDYKGRQYRLISQKERFFSCCERFARGVLACLAILVSLGFALCAQATRDLLLQTKKIIRFAVPFQPRSLTPAPQFRPTPLPPRHIPSHAVSRPASLPTPILQEDNRIDIDQSAYRFFFKREEFHVIQAVEKLIDEPVHEYMTERAPFIPHKKHIKEKGFIIHGNSVLEHPELDGWMMKGGGDRRGSYIQNKAGTSEPNRFDNIMRVFMAERLRQAITENHLEIAIPEKRLLLSRIPPPLGALHKKYYVFSKKITVLDEPQTKEAVRQLPEAQQRKIARNICTLITKTGFMDAHFGNIRWNPTLKEIAIIDTESQGCLIEKHDPSPRTTHALKKCALIGLQEFRDRTAGEFPIFAAEADKSIKALI